jgi:hypothetical protein
MKEGSDGILKKVLRALKVVLLSIFNMDYQIPSQKMKVPKAKLILTVLTTATIIWAIVFYFTSWEYILLVAMALLGGWLGFILLVISGLLNRTPNVTVQP